jgi:hypothetical protein
MNSKNLKKLHNSNSNKITIGSQDLKCQTHTVQVFPHDNNNLKVTKNLQLRN